MKHHSIQVQVGLRGQLRSGGLLPVDFMPQRGLERRGLVCTFVEQRYLLTGIDHHPIVLQHQHNSCDFGDQIGQTFTHAHVGPKTKTAKSIRLGLQFLPPYRIEPIRILIELLIVMTGQHLNFEPRIFHDGDVVQIAILVDLSQKDAGARSVHSGSFEQTPLEVVRVS